MTSVHEEAVTAIDGLGDESRPCPSFLTQARAFYELGKPNVSGLVVVTGVIGFYLASSGGEPLSWWRLMHLVAGMGLTAAGACGLNMVVERDLDRLMRRTRARPIPSGRISALAALRFSLAVFAIGFAELWLVTGPYPALLSLLTLLTYVLFYTPMKRRGPISILIGAVPGAIPPVMGWAAVRGEIGAGGLVLFAILFTWQLPHFLALAWIYRDDYARAGFRFLPQGDATGAKTGRNMAIGCALLLAVSVLPAVLHMAGPVYLAGALLAGLGFFVPCVRAAQRCTVQRARTAFITSVTYLPLLLGLLVLDRIIS